MTAQLDLFSVAQEHPRLSHVDRLWHLAFSDLVKAEVMATLLDHPGEWLKWVDFRTIIEKHKIGSCFGHLLAHMARAGQLLEQTCYLGSQYPWEAGFLGSNSRWAAIGTEGPQVLTWVCGGAPKVTPGDLLTPRRRAA